MSSIHPSLRSCVFVFLLGFTGFSYAQHFVPVNVPGAVQTYVNGMDRNNAQVLVGTYVDDSEVSHGFLYQAGAVTALDLPGAAQTIPQDVNDLGQVVGDYRDAQQGLHGFVWVNGQFTTIDYPGASRTTPGGINNAGTIVGSYRDSEGTEHGFLLASAKYATYDVPGATSTYIAGINNQNHFAGSYLDANGEHAFLQTSSGLQTINAPNAQTFTQDLNNADELVGFYIVTGQETANAFVYSAGNFTTVNYPGAAQTDLTSLSDSGVLTGGATGEGVPSGFVITNGPFVYVANDVNKTVVPIDLATNLPLPAIQFSTYPSNLVVTPNQKSAYVTLPNGNGVAVIDTASNTVTTTIQIPNGPLFDAISPDGTLVYVSLGTGTAIQVIDTATNTLKSPIQVGTSQAFLAISPDGKSLYAASAGTNSVYVIDTASGTIRSTIANVPGAGGPVLSPDGKSLYIVNTTEPGSVTVIDTTTDTIKTTIPVGNAPIALNITPDGRTVYVCNILDNTLSIIDTASNKVIKTVPANGGAPGFVIFTPDGSLAYVFNQLEPSNVSVFSTATNTLAATLPIAGTGGGNAVIVGGTPTSQTLTQPLSPTQPNQFNFGPHSFTVQYPAGTNFSNVNMSVTALQTTQATFKQRTAATFPNATCIVYNGAGGNCVDYQVTCSTTNGGEIPCPGTPAPNIDVKTSYDTQQTIVNPGFLTTPIGMNQWQNIFYAFYLQRIDPTTKGRTKGFSEFYAVDLGPTNSQGAATFQFLAPLRPTDPRVFGAGVTIPVAFQLRSVTNPGKFVTDSKTGLSLVMVADANGNPVSDLKLSLKNPFQYQTGGSDYLYSLNTTGYAAGTYNLTVYGNAFAAQQVQFTLQARNATTCSIVSSSEIVTQGQPITFTATVKAKTGAPTGTVSFIDSGYSQIVLGTAPLVSGTAQLSVILPSAPNQQWVRAVYSGDNTFAGCKSAYIPERYTQQPE